MSISKAWKRLGSKCSPSKMVLLSPIRPCEHLVGKNKILNEAIISAQIWILMNTEEFHYQNTSLLVHHNFKNVETLRITLQNKWDRIDWENRLVDYQLIAQGGFGQVYRAIDQKTNIEYALKRIIPPEQDNVHSLSRFSSNLLQERNIFLELNQSPFFVRILAAFQSKNQTEFWFVLDFCFTNLRQIISIYPYRSDFELLSTDYIDGIAWEKVSEIMTNLWSTNYEELVFIYLFEMLCTLHYLATRHIVHSDIKPENFLIDKNCHLKLTDFGVSFRNDWFFRNSIIELPKTIEKLKEIDREDENIHTIGTFTYYDPEQVIGLMSSTSLDMIELMNRLENSAYFFSISSTSTSFLSDLYAVGLITIEMITGGLQMAEESIMPHISEDFWNIEMIYDDNLRENVFERPLSRLPCDRAKSEIFTFLISIFTPREIRSQNFLTTEKIFQQKNRKTVSCIDILKIENILYYKSMSITKENVQSIVFPQPFINNILELSKRKKYRNPDPLILSKSEKKAFNLYPFAFS